MLIKLDRKSEMPAQSVPELFLNFVQYQQEPAILPHCKLQDETLLIMRETFESRTIGQGTGLGQTSGDLSMEHVAIMVYFLCAS